MAYIPFIHPPRFQIASGRRVIKLHYACSLAVFENGSLDGESIIDQSANKVHRRLGSPVSCTKGHTTIRAINWTEQFFKVLFPPPNHVAHPLRWQAGKVVL